MTVVNSVAGPVSADDLGFTLMHEHVLIGYPGWEGDLSLFPYEPQKMVDHAVPILQEVKELGVDSYVDATAIDHARDVEVLQQVSEKSEVNIICSTGYYFEIEGASSYWRFMSHFGDGVKGLADLFHQEITNGIRGTDIKAGVIKVGTGNNLMTDYEKMVFTAAARVQKETGVPIITHTQEGTMGPEQASFLIEAGADPKKVQIGHMCCNLDLDYQMKALDQGVYLGWDRFGIQGIAGCPMDKDRYPLLVELINKGYADRLMLSQDCAMQRVGRTFNVPKKLIDLLHNHHPSHVPKRVIPTLKQAGVTEDQITTITRENPRRLFAG